MTATLTAAGPASPHRAGGTLPCNPDTLMGVCAGTCGRRLHRGRSRGNRRACADGHPVHRCHGMCSGCATAAAAPETAPRPARVTAPAVQIGDVGQWKASAACRTAEPDLFFPEVRGRGDIRKFVWPAARDYCDDCPVADACHQVAERTGSTGLWAGLWRRVNGDHVPLTAGARARMRRAS